MIYYLNKIEEKAEACSIADSCELYCEIWLYIAFMPTTAYQFYLLYIVIRKIIRTNFKVPRIELQDLFNSISG